MSAYNKLSPTTLRVYMISLLKQNFYQNNLYQARTNINFHVQKRDLKIIYKINSTCKSFQLPSLKNFYINCN